MRVPLFFALSVTALGGCGSAGSGATAGARSAADVQPAVTAEDAIAAVHRHRVADAEGDEVPTLASQAWRASDGGPWLVHVTIAQGAYQPTGELFRVAHEGHVTALEAPLVEDDGSVGTTEVVGEVSFDQHTRVVTDYTRYRGLGDCGRRLRFRLEPDGSLVLVEHHEQSCPADEAGEHVTDPDAWPARAVPGQDPAPASQPEG